MNFTPKSAPTLTIFGTPAFVRTGGAIKQEHFTLWNAVAVWKADSRYNIIGTIQKADAELMIGAAEQLLKAL